MDSGRLEQKQKAISTVSNKLEVIYLGGCKKMVGEKTAGVK